MRRRVGVILAVTALLAGGMSAAQGAGSAADPGADAITVYEAEVSRAQVPLLLQAGQDGHEFTERVPASGTATVEVYLSRAQAKELRGKGVELEERTVGARAEARVEAAADGVFRPYGGSGGLKEEIIATGQAHPGLTKVVSIGKTVLGQDILAVKVSRNAKQVKDGAKPSTLFAATQHAREWIVPEMTRRLMHHYLDNYGKDPRITKIIDSTESWFVLVANPDGYDWTHNPAGDRMWRKNMRDVNGDGAFTIGDGVDLNRNFAYKWGYDNEGSSANPTSDTYRGAGPSSEPETRALDAFERRIGFEYGINYHSAAELILYGVGWQIATPTPDDVLYRSLAGTPENPAVPGYRPQVSSELYTTNGEADGHAANVNGIMMFTPEMSTCQTISNLYPDDEWLAQDCGSGFHFPDDEALIQEEFEKNIPFALSVAETTSHPDQPSSPVGIAAPDFTPDTFTTSYARGADQEVSVTARRSVGDKELNYRINGGRTHREDLTAWRGGETWGGEDNIRFDEYRAEVEDADPGDTVQVWFTGRTRDGKRTASEPFTYTVAQRARADTIVVADEGAAATQAQTYVAALNANGRSAVVWDAATQGAPHALGVLSHFGTAVHYTGDALPGGATQLALRAYLNEGGKLIEAGERAGGSTLVGNAATNDFSQYYLGAYTRTNSVPTAFDGNGALEGPSLPLAAAPGNPLNRAGLYTVTSDSLPPAQYPEFADSAAAGQYPGVVNPFAPYEGAWMASAPHEDSDWRRLTRTLDLTGVTAADAPQLRFALNWNVEEGYDHILLEAHTAGAADWTTLPEAGGRSSSAVPTECEAGYYIGGHPFLAHYLTLGAGSCTANGTSGVWNSLTGSSGGWQQVAYDLSAYAGKQVEVSLAYVTDPAFGFQGVFADNARLALGSTEQAVEGFETSLGPWTVPGPPAGSPAVPGDWARSGELFLSHGAVTTDDTVLLGFGLEHVPGAADRNALLGKALTHLRD